MIVEFVTRPELDVQSRVFILSIGIMYIVVELDKIISAGEDQSDMETALALFFEKLQKHSHA